GAVNKSRPLVPWRRLQCGSIGCLAQEAATDARVRAACQLPFSKLEDHPHGRGWPQNPRPSSFCVVDLPSWLSSACRLVEIPSREQRFLGNLAIPSSLANVGSALKQYQSTDEAEGV